MLTLYSSPVKSTLWQNLLKTKKSPKKSQLDPEIIPLTHLHYFPPFFANKFFSYFGTECLVQSIVKKTLNDPSKQKANKLNSAEHYRRVEGYGGGLTHVKITLVME